MQADFAEKLMRALSNERLSAYARRATEQGNRTLFAHYAWNMALSESLYPVLQALEVLLRNTIDNAARDHFGRADWYDDPKLIQHPNDISSIDKAKRILNRQNKPLEPGRIIAELNFGFWTSLFDRRYEQVFWPRMIKTTFPHMPRRIRTRQTLSKRLHKIRILRNRIFHHEPIWYWQDLSQQHLDILQTISWIEPAMCDLVEIIDRFPSTYNDGLEGIIHKLKQFC
ncbi:MAG: Abi family protein [Pseudomonadota bacterium]|nr:Abi family protein [Pseudomonadota bacterium]